jgi:hypothetical protein
MLNDGATMLSRTVMTSDERPGGVTAAQRAILRHLRREWPDSVDLTARNLLPGISDADFLAACVALQDDGLIMYEALLVGTGPSPMLVAAVLTRKGQAEPGADNSGG